MIAIAGRRAPMARSSLSNSTSQAGTPGGSTSFLDSAGEGGRSLDVEDVEAASEILGLVLLCALCISGTSIFTASLVTNC